MLSKTFWETDFFQTSNWIEELESDVKMSSHFLQGSFLWKNLKNNNNNFWLEQASEQIEWPFWPFSESKNIQKFEHLMYCILAIHISSSGRFDWKYNLCRDNDGRQVNISGTEF